MSVGPAEALERVAQALDELGVDYYIGGSVASSIHGTFRQTADVDFIAALPLEKAEALAQRLGAEFYADPESIQEAVSSGSSFNVIHLETMDKCDVFVPRPDAWTEEEMRTRVQRPLFSGEDASFWIEAPAGTVLQKLRWFQMGGGVSDRQWRDIQGVIRTQGAALDRDYLRHWAPFLGVSAELERALAEAE